MGPHVGAVVGAMIYQICVGFHWPQEEDSSELQTDKSSNINYQYDGPALRNGTLHNVLSSTLTAI